MAEQVMQQGASQRPTSGPEQPRLRIQHRLARLGAVRSRLVIFDPLFRIIKVSHLGANLLLIEHIHRTVEQLYQGQKRKFGDPYITHPLTVAIILVELGMTEPVLVAVLLHDTVEDTEYTLEQLREEFTDEVARMADGVTKLDKVTYGEIAKAETIRKMTTAASEEVWVLVIKLVDRLHNMWTIGFLRPDKQVRIATETLSILAPLAHRLGMNTVKWELKDLSPQAIESKIYSEIVDLVAQQVPGWERYLWDLIAQSKQLMADNKVKVTIYDRPKHFYSTYQKMMARGRDFADIYDLIRLRVSVDNVQDCYGVLGVVHSKWKPIPGRFEDYITNPKFNMYQSLHTTVLGDRDEPVELQTRTHEVHRRAEYGVAAHWRHKENLCNGVTPEEVGLRATHQLGVMSKETEDPTEFLDSILFEINSDEIHVFTPKGEVNVLPVGTTPVDFAFFVYTKAGYCCIDARVSGRLVALSTKLVQDDKVKILISKSLNADPSRDWLGFIATSRVRQEIKQHFSWERRDEAIENSKETLARQLRCTGLPMQRLLALENLTAVANELRHADVPSLYRVIGEGQIGARSVVTHLMELVGGEDEAVDTITEDEGVRNSQRRSRAATESRVLMDGDPTMAVKLVRCCHPTPDDEITGFVARTDEVSVCRVDCMSVPALQGTPKRLVKVIWDKVESGQFPATIQVEGIDRSGLLADVSRVVLDSHVDILEATLTSDRNKKFSGRLTLESLDPKYLNRVLKQVRRVPGVYDASHTNFRSRASVAPARETALITLGFEPARADQVR